jgi:outer membrane protein OmpA-like peptidoglycan-associated protein
MRQSVAFLLLVGLFAGCAGPDGGKYSVVFQPYSSALDPSAQATVHNAAAFAGAHPLMPLSISGYATPSPIDTGDIETLRQLRVQTVQQALISEGVSSFRIEVLGTGLQYPDGVPDSPIGRVDIAVGL